MKGCLRASLIVALMVSIFYNAILVKDHKVIIIVLRAAITRAIFRWSLSHTGKVVFTPQAFPKISLLGAHLFSTTVNMERCDGFRLDARLGPYPLLKSY